MRIPSNSTLENQFFRPIPVCDASAPLPYRDLTCLSFLEKQCSTGLRKYCDDKSRFFPCLERRSAEVIAFLNTHQCRSGFKRSEDYRYQGAAVCGVSNIGGNCCLKTEVILELLNDGVAKYGTVLDCTKAARPQQAKDENSEKLTCGDDKPETGGMLFKAGRKEKQHIVGIQPNGTGTVFQLLYVEARAEKNNPA